MVKGGEWEVVERERERERTRKKCGRMREKNKQSI